MNILSGLPRFFTTLLLGLSCSTLALARVYTDSAYGFKLEIPDDWKQEVSQHGQDRLFTASRPDGNLAVQIHVMRLDRKGVGSDILRQAFEKTVLPKAQLAGVKPYSLNGLDGDVAAYRLRNNGENVVLSAFFTLRGKRGYILTSLVPEKLYQSLTTESDRITNSFQLIKARDGKVRDDEDGPGPIVRTTPTPPPAPSVDPGWRSAAVPGWPMDD